MLPRNNVEKVGAWSEGVSGAEERLMMGGAVTDGVTLCSRVGVKALFECDEDAG